MQVPRSARDVRPICSRGAETVAPRPPFDSHGNPVHPCYWNQNPELYIDDRENPYRTTDGTDFVWIRGRQVGGKSLTWVA